MTHRRTWRNFSESKVWRKIPEASALILGDTGISFKHSVTQAEERLCAKNELDPLSRFDTIPACDRHTHTHTQTDK